MSASVHKGAAAAGSSATALGGMRLQLSGALASFFDLDSLCEQYCHLPPCSCSLRGTQLRLLVQYEPLIAALEEFVFEYAIDPVLRHSQTIALLRNLLILRDVGWQHVPIR